jgi:hypothetical protein
MVRVVLLLMGLVAGWIALRELFTEVTMTGVRRPRALGKVDLPWREVREVRVKSHRRGDFVFIKSNTQEVVLVLRLFKHPDLFLVLLKDLVPEDTIRAGDVS